jgi:uncharacterized membrane protein YoaK (UPF0700 family)
MFSKSPDAIYSPKNRFLWYLLCFQGGFVNIGGMLAVHHFVSHITGFAGLTAIAFFRANYIEVLLNLLIPVFFLFGSFVTGLFTEVRRQQGKAPVYVFSMIAIAFVFLTIALLGPLNLLGNFGAPIEGVRDYGLLCLLSFACGAQNALFTSASAAIVRTTHLTGITTDLGIGLAKVFAGKYSAEDFAANRLRIAIIVNFLLGSFVGVYCFNHFHYSAFFIPAGLSLFIAHVLRRTRLLVSGEEGSRPL